MKPKKKIKTDDNSFIFKLNPNRDSHQASHKFYTIKGHEDFVDYENNPRQKQENWNTQAKSITKTDGSIHHYIKITGNGKPFNPSEEYMNVRSALLLKTIGKTTAEFKEVNHRVFIMYLSFLRTKNTAWLHNTEREMI